MFYYNLSFDVYYFDIRCRPVKSDLVPENANACFFLLANLIGSLAGRENTIHRQVLQAHEVLSRKSGCHESRTNAKHARPAGQRLQIRERRCRDPKQQRLATPIQLKSLQSRRKKGQGFRECHHGRGLGGRGIPIKYATPFHGTAPEHEPLQ